MNKKTSIDVKIEQGTADKVLSKHITQEDARKFILDRIFVNFEPKHILSGLANLIQEYGEGGLIRDGKWKKGVQEAIQSAQPLVGLDTHHVLAQSIDERHRSFAVELCRRLEKEYSCDEASEKMLVETMVSAFVRVLEYSNQLNRNSVGGNPITNERNGLYSFFSKEIDRANRQYLQALTTLRQFKAPKLEVNIRTKNAFIAGNQQINANPEACPV